MTHRQYGALMVVDRELDKKVTGVQGEVYCVSQNKASVLLVHGLFHILCCFVVCFIIVF